MSRDLADVHGFGGGARIGADVHSFADALGSARYPGFHVAWAGIWRVSVAFHAHGFSRFGADPWDPISRCCWRMSRDLAAFHRLVGSPCT